MGELLKNALYSQPKTRKDIRSVHTVGAGPDGATSIRVEHSHLMRAWNHDPADARPVHKEASKLVLG